MMSTFGPLHATETTTPYLSLLARIENFRWQDFAHARYEERQFYKLRCIRGTLHVVPAAQADTISCLYRPAERYAEFDEYNIPQSYADDLRFQMMEVLDTHGAQSVSSIKKYLPEKYLQKFQSGQEETTAIAIVLRWLASLGLVEIGTHVSDWRRKDNDYRIAETLPQSCEGISDADLARIYFELYAPAAYEDWTWWSGFSASRNQAAFDAIREMLVEVHVEGMSQTLYIPQAQLEDLQNMPDEKPEMVRLLPYEDALIKAYKATRYRFYDDDGVAGESVFTKHGEAQPTLWLDGQIMGVWSWTHKPDEPMTVEPFVLQMTRALRKRLKPEVEHVQQFIEASHLIWSS
jgi:hypothetical protein